MIELIRCVAASDPDRPAIVWADERWSYGWLDAAANSYAQGLLDAGIDRFAIVSNDIAEVVALLAAGSLVGAEACVYAPDATTEDVVRQAATLSHETLVSTRDDLDATVATVWRPHDLRTPGPRIDAPPARRPLLVLTTGTTGAPRGVRHDWGRQLARAEKVRDGAGQTWLLAYGPQQFAGLQVLIHVFASGASLVAPPVRRPQAVVEAIYAHEVDHISATPTFWRFLLAELRTDPRPAPALRQITLGGEASGPRLLADLAATFPSAGISHIYAGSEFGSTGSVRDGQGGLPAALLERDETGEVSIKIVDGELWVRSAAGMLGYHGEPDLPDGEWWCTGDSVEVVGERIVFRGRRSEIINVGGVKVHPLPVEDCIAAVPGVKVSRVYGRANALVGAVVAVDVVPDGDPDEQELKAAIRQACQSLPRSWQPRSIRVVPDTTMKENKLVRGAGPGPGAGPE